MTAIVEFGPLLNRPLFRSDLLYFIRLAGNYAASIVIDCRARASKKDKAAFSRWLGLDIGIDRQKAKAEPSAKALQKRLWQQFLDRNPAFVSAVDKKPHIKQDIWRALAFGEPWFDVFKTDFPTIMSEMPIPMRERLSATLQKDHLLPWRTEQFLTAIKELTAYRHWLEHRGDKTNKGELRPTVSDQKLLQILGLMLLPYLGNHLVGRIRHHERRSGVRRSAMMADHAKEVLADALATRRETSKLMNGLKRRVDPDTIRARITQKNGNPPSDAAVHRISREGKKKLRDLENRKASLLELHIRYFDKETWPRYNFENFLIRFGFISKARIAELERLLGVEGNAKPDFIHAIEPAFMLSLDLALIMHVWLSELEERGVKIRDRNEMKKLGDAAKHLPDIRNAIAHGGWIWHVVPKGQQKPLTLTIVMQSLLAALEHSNINDKASRRNNLLTQLESRLRKERRDRVYRTKEHEPDPNRRSPPIVIKRWTEEKRAKYTDEARWRIEKRPAVRRVAAGWMRDISTIRREWPEKF